MNSVPPSLPERIHQTKLRHKQIALAVHQRATRQARQKIAWAIVHHPREALAFARETLARQIQRWGQLPRYRAWDAILGASPEIIAEQLLREDSRVQQRNSCHPFGSALSIYEAHHPKRPA
jgi:hypothetical protein